MTTMTAQRLRPRYYEVTAHCGLCSWSRTATVLVDPDDVTTEKLRLLRDAARYHTHGWPDMRHWSLAHRELPASS